MLDRLEVPLPEPEQDRAVELGVTSHVVVLLGAELLAVVVGPFAGVVVAPFGPHCSRAPVLRLTGQPAAALEKQHLRARGRERIRYGAAAGSRADNDDVVVIGHDTLLRRSPAARPTRRWHRAAWRGR